jgi:hypothetical protein
MMQQMLFWRPHSTWYTPHLHSQHSHFGICPTVAPRFVPRVVNISIVNKNESSDLLGSVGLPWLFMHFSQKPPVTLPYQNSSSVACLYIYFWFINDASRNLKLTTSNFRTPDIHQRRTSKHDAQYQWEQSVPTYIRPTDIPIAVKSVTVSANLFTSEGCQNHGICSHVPTSWPNFVNWQGLWCTTTGWVLPDVDCCWWVEFIWQLWPTTHGSSWDRKSGGTGDTSGQPQSPCRMTRHLQGFYRRAKSSRLVALLAHQ